MLMEFRNCYSATAKKQQTSNLKNKKKKLKQQSQSRT